MRGTTQRHLKHSRPPPKQCKHVETAVQEAGKVSKKTTKLITYPKIKSRAVSERILFVWSYAVLQILSTYR